MTDWNNMLEQTRAAITGYELAAESLAGVVLAQGYVVTCDDLPLAFDVAGGMAGNPRVTAPQLATRFTLDDAALVAVGVRNGNGSTGQVVHVRHAIASALARQRELLGFLLDHSDMQSIE